MAPSDKPLRPRAILALILVFSIGFAAGCGGGDDETAEPEQARDPVPVESLNGKTFNSTEVKGHELVDGTMITLSFGPDALTASAGCNSIRGAMEVDDGSFYLSKTAGTLVGCPSDRQAQDEWLTSVLGAGLRPYDDGGNLLLLGRGVEITMEEGTVPGGPPPIVGTTWELNSYSGSDGTVSSVKQGVRLPFILFKGNGTLSIFDGCDEGKGLADVYEDRGMIRFAVVRSTLKTCPGLTGEVSDAMLRVLEGETSYTFEGQNLVISRKGSTLTFTPG